MAIAKITRPGLAAIALSVALLWACALGERALTQRAFHDRVCVMQELQRTRGPGRMRVTVPVNPARTAALQLS